jgi:hypothetical protein
VFDPVQKELLATNNYPYLKIVLKDPVPVRNKNMVTGDIVGYVFGVRFITIRGECSGLLFVVINSLLTLSQI